MASPAACASHSLHGDGRGGSETYARRRPDESVLYGVVQAELETFLARERPVPRFGDFASQWRSLRPLPRDRAELVKAYLRIFWGVLQISLIGAACLDVYHGGARDVGSARWIRVVSVLYGYPAYIYFNFAGCCSLVIGSAALLGLRLSENFNRPFASRNVLDFWSRWHMTLTHWLCDYLFTPLYKFVVEHWPGKALWLAPVCYMIVFLVAGVWHGSTMNFAIFGLLHGLGAGAAKGWETMIVKREGRKGLRRYMQSPAIGVLARVANLNYICATFLFFPSGLTNCMEVIRSVFLGVQV